MMIRLNLGDQRRQPAKLVRSLGGLRLVLIGLLMITAVGCGPTASPKSSSAVKESPTTTPAAAPKIVVVGGYTHDFGTREVGEMFENDFIIKNEGNADLTLVKGTPSCTTCTSFDLDSLVVHPGQSTKAHLKWHVKTENPEFSQYGPITTNDPKMAEVRLYAKAKVIKRVVLQPHGEWDIGTVQEQVPKEFVATLTSAIVEKLELVSVTNSSPHLKVTATPMSSDKLAEHKAKSGYEFKAVLSPEIPVGNFTDKVTIRIKSPDLRTLIVDVTGQRHGPLEIFGPSWNQDRMQLSLGAFDPRKPLSVKLNLFTRGIPGELKITKVTCPDDRFSVEVKPDTRFKGQTGDHRRYEMLIHVAAGNRPIVYAPNGPLECVLETNQETVGSIKLKFTAQALLE